MGKILLMPVNSSKIINAWSSYDAANSGYTLCISTVLYPIYYNIVTKESFGSQFVNFLGISIKNTVLYEYAIAFGYLLAIIITILLAGIADTKSYRKRFMQLFTYIGALACIGMYAFTGSNIGIGITMPILAVIGFACSLVYYNSFLPLIATPDKHDAISAKGFAFGYAGSMLLLIFILLQIEFYNFFGFSSTSQLTRFAFVEVGLWWFLISLISFKYLKENPTTQKENKSVLLHGINELIKVFNEIKKHKSLYRYLIAFFFFSIGVQTIMIMATLFGSVELQISQNKLIMTILLIQLTAITGAFLFSKLAMHLNDKIALLIMLTIWIVICVSAYYITTELHFLIMGSLTGFVMGGIQSQARAIWSKFIPAKSNSTASYFSFYDNTEKLAIVIGMFSFGFIEKITGNMRISTLTLSVFFIASLLIILFTSFKTESNI